jgi:tetraacyldisaccharide 4'-kinase
MGEHAPAPALAVTAAPPQPAMRLRTRLSKRLQRSWVTRDWLSVLLLDVSWLYGGLVKLRRWLYAKNIFESERVPVPVIVVGNVVAGGAGKTPVVIEIVKYLKAQGWQPGVVSRGYGRTPRREDVNDSGFMEVTANTPANQCGDEPALIHRVSEAPVFVASRRSDAALALLAAYPNTNVIVSDDGLQHLALQRDIEVCVFDERGVGNGSLLPAGPLREPWPRKVDFVLQTAPFRDQSPSIRVEPPTVRIEPVEAPNGNPSFTLTRQLALYALRADGSRVSITELAGKTLCAVAAIAHPEAFFAMLRAQGMILADTIALPDHYNYDSWSRPHPLTYTLICTEKDAVKVWKTHPDALAVPLQVNIPPEFFTALAKKLSSPHGHQTT